MMKQGYSRCPAIARRIHATLRGNRAMPQERPRRLLRWLIVILVVLSGVVAFAITQDWFAGTWPWGSHLPGQGTVKASKMKVTAGKMVVTEFGAIQFIKG